MWTDRLQDARHGRAVLLLVVFLVLFFLILGNVTIFAGLTLFLILLFFIQIFGNDVQVNGMGLRHFELGFTLRATQDLALFDLIFVDIDLCGTFRAADHGFHPPYSLSKGLAPPRPGAPPSSVLYNAEYEVNSPGRIVHDCPQHSTSLDITWHLRENIRNGPWSVWEA